MPSYVNYTVKKGDTIYSIAKNNNISTDTLIKDNGLIDNNLKIGADKKDEKFENILNELFITHESIHWH